MTTFRVLCIIALGVGLSACGSISARPPAIERSPSEPVAATENNATPIAKKPGSKKSGGYYLDDGPGDNPPADIDAIPDAIPRVEPLKSGTTRPYTALGQSYTPMKEYQPYRERGIASWYGRRYHGQKTASGEIYDMYGMSAAHTTLPIPSYVRVTNPDNGKSVIVRVNDRGPFHSDRLIDLSYAAAYKLRLVDKGSGQVEIEAIDARNYVAPEVSATPASTSSPDTKLAGTFVQVGAFKLKENADQLRDKLQQQQIAQNIAVASWYNEGIYRVRLGPYASRDAAENAALTIRQTLGIAAVVQNP